jgi:hypothetical protein
MVGFHVLVRFTVQSENQQVKNSANDKRLEPLAFFMFLINVETFSGSSLGPV